MQQLTPRYSTPVSALLAQGFTPATFAGLQGLNGLAGTQAANIILSTGSTVATASTGTIAAAISSASWAVPVVGAAIAGVTMAIGAWINRKGPGQKIITTKIVDEAEPILQQNLAAYQSGPHTISSQQVALANFDNVWAQVEEACGNPAYGNPGQACINDRKRGSTKGYDWFALYRDPIANDALLVPDPSPDSITSGAITDILNAGSGPSLVPLFLLAGLMLVVVKL